MIFKIFCLAVAICLVSCVSGDKLDSKIKYLNAESYKNRKSILMIPVLKTKDQEIKK